MKNEVPDFVRHFEKMKRSLPRKVAGMAVNRFKSSFDKGGFMDRSFHAWQPRKGDTRSGGAILVQTGHLRDSIKIDSATMRQVSISNDAPQASLHNEGGIVKMEVTAKMRKYFWYMHKATGEGKWKGMALTKKTHFIFRMPKRQFMGESADLMNRIDREFEGQISRVMRTFK